MHVYVRVYAHFYAYAYAHGALEQCGSDDYNRCSAIADLPVHTAAKLDEHSRRWMFDLPPTHPSPLAGQLYISSSIAGRLYITSSLAPPDGMSSAMGIAIDRLAAHCSRYGATFYF